LFVSHSDLALAWESGRVARLRTVVLGLTEWGEDFCAAARQDPGLELIAVADHDRALAARTAERLGVRAFADYRSVLVEQSPQVVLAAIPPHERPEYLRIAAAGRAAVLMAGPPLPSFDATVEQVRLFAATGTPCAVVRVWQSEPAYVRLGNLEAFAGRLLAAQVTVHTARPDLAGWRGDSVRAGGGVLLHDAYDQLDALVTLFGLPQQVWAVLDRTPATDDARPYDTEDVATVLLRFSDRRAAALTCRRAGQYQDWQCHIFGTRATVQISPQQMSLTDAHDGAVTLARVQTANRAGPAVATFATALTAGLNRMFSPLDDHLATMAVMQTAYLSARTGQPESPGKFYRPEPVRGSERFPSGGSSP
jgi:predicted dehydrogenase